MLAYNPGNSLRQFTLSDVVRDYLLLSVQVRLVKRRVASEGTLASIVGQV
jgi:hypothetical protein